MSFSVALPLLEERASASADEAIFSRDRVALHSGKLGDVIYALPTCRALGINHLVLNVHLPPDEPLRWMDAHAAKSLVPLLLAQGYLRKVSVTECDLPLEHASGGIEGVEFNFDRFRHVARHLVGPPPRRLSRQVVRYSPDRHPVHLAQVFAASQGVRVDAAEKWLEAPPSPESAGTVVVSVTRNWRTYPDWYWPLLLDGLSRARFVGAPGERERAGLSHLAELAAPDHLALASHIAGCDLFLGTVSFPYAIAEGLKQRRAVEICHTNLNAFPVGKDGWVLPPNVLAARELVAQLLGLERHSDYRARTRDLARRPSILFRALALPARLPLPLFARRASDATRRVARRALSLARRLVAAAQRAARIATLAPNR